jgi:hypothetical protein
MGSTVDNFVPRTDGEPRQGQRNSAASRPIGAGPSLGGAF